MGRGNNHKTIRKPQRLSSSQRRLIRLLPPLLQIRVNVRTLTTSLLRLMRQTDDLARTAPISFEEEYESAARYSLPNENLTITSIETTEELRKLPVCQLKHLLNQNQIIFENTYERENLLELAERLWHDKHRPMERDFEHTCKICKSADIDCALLDCGHQATCFSCAELLKKCPICRQYIKTLVKTFRQ